MATLIQQSTALDPLFFFLTQSADHITALTGASPSVSISKNGAAFGAPTGAVSEVASGWYQVAGNATDTNTLGVILLHATAASADPCDLVAAQIVGFNPRSTIGQDANVISINGVALGAQTLGRSTQSICYGTVGNGSTTTSIVVSSLTNPTTLNATGQLNGRTLIFLGNTLTGALQACAASITNSTTGPTPTITVTALAGTPNNGDTFAIL